MFHGHRFIKINDEWVFDITECVGYSVKLNSHGNVEQYYRKYKIQPEQWAVEKVSDVPDLVIYKTMVILSKYMQMALA